jgi:serine/threonine protein kinase
MKKTKKKIRTQSRSQSRKRNWRNLWFSENFHSFSKNRILNKNKQKGGRYLGEGSYGCVITPAIKCGKSGSATTDVSKLILNPTKDIKTELLISKRLRDIDPKQDYFITFKQTCRLEDVPTGRNNVVRAKIYGRDFSQFRKMENKNLADEFCPIDMSKKPINIIMPNAGYDLFGITDFIYNYNKYNNNPQRRALNIPNEPEARQIYMDKITIMEELKRNFRGYLKYLLSGLLIMHQNRIAARDIKLDNITVSIDPNKQSKLKCRIRYIDFGLSEDLTPEYCSHKSNIILQGTYDYIPPEIFITFNIHYYRGYPDITTLKQINQDIKDNVIKFNNNIERNIGKLKSIIIDLFSKIKKEYQNNTILAHYFGSADGISNLNGYLQKGDVYSLAASIYQFLYYSKIRNINLNKYGSGYGSGSSSDDILLLDLLNKMMDFNPDTRYNVQQCLDHSYFK